MNARIEPERKQWAAASEWLERADDDLAIVDLVMKEAEPLIFMAAFHCQEAVEKFAKAYLVAFRTDPPKTHDIGKLATLVEETSQDTGEMIRELDVLTKWYIPARYPGDFDDTVSKNDILDALPKVQALQRHILSLAPKS